MKRLIVALTCVVLIGVSGSTFAQSGGYYGHGKEHGHGGKHQGSARNDGKSNFSNRIYRITDADSLQQIKMKPMVEKASKRMEALRLSYQKQEKRVLDSLSLQLKPILKEDQMKKLDDFNYHQQDRARRR